MKVREAAEEGSAIVPVTSSRWASGMTFTWRSYRTGCGDFDCAPAQLPLKIKIRSIKTIRIRILSIAAGQSHRLTSGGGAETKQESSSKLVQRPGVSPKS